VTVHYPNGRQQLVTYRQAFTGEQLGNICSLFVVVFSPVVALLASRWTNRAMSDCEHSLITVQRTARHQFCCSASARTMCRLHASPHPIKHTLFAAIRASLLSNTFCTFSHHHHHHRHYCPPPHLRCPCASGHGSPLVRHCINCFEGVEGDVAAADALSIHPPAPTITTTVFSLHLPCPRTRQVVMRTAARWCATASTASRVWRELWCLRMLCWLAHWTSSAAWSVRGHGASRAAQVGINVLSRGPGGLGWE
jgi:hypothetical protein